MNQEIEVGDLIHARLYNSDRTQVMIQDFKVSEIEGTVYKGGVQDCDTASGWELELVRKSVANLGLPETISEITVYNNRGKKAFLTGKGETWRDEQGKNFPVSNIFRWEEGHV